MSIPHFTALSKKRRTEFLEHPDRFTCQEKVDGTHFIIGCDNKGLWTSRKNGKEKRRQPGDWGKEYWAAHFREAHIAAEHFAWHLRKVLGDHYEIECELLSSYYPNTIEYHTPRLRLQYHNVGHIVVHSGLSERATISDACIAHVNDIPFTLDGMTTQYMSDRSWWMIDEICDEEKFENHIIAAAQKPEEEQETYLLDVLVRTVISRYGDSEIEGLVFKHKTDGWMLKLVDREHFTKRNTENYLVRKKLFKTPGQKSNSVTDVYCRNITDGMDEVEAKSLAYQATSKLLVEYLSGKLPDSESIHRRNMEAFAALHQQFSQ